MLKFFGNLFKPDADKSGGTGEALATSTGGEKLTDAAAHLERGESHFDNGEYDSAIADFSQAITLNPKDAFAYLSRGNAYGIKGEYDFAIADFNQAIALNPGDAIAYCRRGLAYGYKGDHDLAIAHFCQALALSPRMPLPI